MNSEPGGSAAFTPPYLQSPVAIHSRRFADTTTSDTHSSPAGLPRRPSDGLRFDAGGLQRRQIPSPLVFSPETSLHPSSGPTSLMDAGMDTGFNSMSFIRKHVFRRLKLAKGCVGDLSLHYLILILPPVTVIASCNALAAPFRVTSNRSSRRASTSAKPSASTVPKSVKSNENAAEFGEKPHTILQRTGARRTCFSRGTFGLRCSLMMAPLRAGSIMKRSARVGIAVSVSAFYMPRVA
jgi:hypothetical protein